MVGSKCGFVFRPVHKGVEWRWGVWGFGKYPTVQLGMGSFFGCGKVEGYSERELELSEPGIWVRRVPEV